MALTLHNLAKTYKMLPSQVLQSATTFDLYVLDLSTRHQRRQQEIAEQGHPTKKTPKLSKEEMMQMLKRVRGEK